MVTLLIIIGDGGVSKLVWSYKKGWQVANVGLVLFNTIRIWSFTQHAAPMQVYLEVQG